MELRLGGRLNEISEIIGSQIFNSLVAQKVLYEGVDVGTIRWRSETVDEKGIRFD